MRIVQSIVLLLTCGIALRGQNAIYTAGTPDSAPAGLMGAKTFAFVSGELVGGNPVKGAPYSGNAVTETTQTLADGNHIVNRITAAVYRDGEGRERREQSIPNIGPFAAQGAPPTTIFISDPVSGVSYTLNPNKKTAMKLPALPAGMFPPPIPPGINAGVNVVAQVPGVAAPNAGVSVMPPPGAPHIMIYNKLGGLITPNPQNAEQLGTKILEGIPAEGIRSTFTIPAGQIGNDLPIKVVDEVWRSPELQVIVHSEHSDPRFGSTIYSLKDISRSDPLPTLFQVPADYTVRDSPAFSIKKAQPPSQ